jgi:hypothetical protein
VHPGCPKNETITIHPQHAGYHGQDINQADVVLLQWPLHYDMPRAIAAADLTYYERRTSAPDTKVNNFVCLFVCLFVESACDDVLCSFLFCHLENGVHSA